MSQNQTPVQDSEAPIADNTPTPPDSVAVDGEDFKYCCPYCNTTYQHELLTRVHISRSDDVDHLNHNGLMPEVEIEVLNQNDETVSVISRRPEEIDLETLTLADFPAELKETHKHILLVAARNLHEPTYTEIADQVEKRLNGNELDAPSYSTIRRVVRRFYRPQEQSGDKDQSEAKDSLEHLTPKQQSIIIARLCSPDAPVSEIANQVDCAVSYPSQVIEQHKHLFSNLRAEIEKGEEPEKIILGELSEQDIKGLLDRDLLNEVPIPLDAVTDQRDTNKKWGSPVKHQRGMTANPHTEQSVDTVNTSSEKQVTLDNSVSDKSPKSESKNPNRNDAAETELDQAIPRSEVEKLKQNVGFLRETFEHSQPKDIGSEIVVSFAEKIEESCDQILHQQSQS